MRPWDHNGGTYMSFPSFTREGHICPSSAERVKATFIFARWVNLNYTEPVMRGHLEWCDKAGLTVQLLNEIMVLLRQNLTRNSAQSWVKLSSDRLEVESHHLGTSFTGWLAIKHTICALWPVNHIIQHTTSSTLALLTEPNTGFPPKIRIKKIPWPGHKFP